MIEGLLLLVLVAVIFTGPGLDRSFVIHGLFVGTVGMGAVLMIYQQDWLALAGWAVLSANMLRRPYPMQHQARLATIAALYAVYAFTPPIHTDWLLMGIASIVVIFALSWDFILFKHESFRDMLCTLGIACVVALILKGYWLWAVALGPLLFPLFAFRKLTTPLQAHVWVAGIVIMAIHAWTPWVGIFIALVAGAYFGLKPIPLGASLRWRAWRTLLRLQWSYGWTARLFGMGHDAWLQWADAVAGLVKQKTGKAEAESLTNPHNEYVSILFEHGMVGLAVFAAWACSLLWNAFQHDPALLIPGLTLAAIALTLFPWSFPREIQVQGKTFVTYEPFGHMSTIILALLIAILLKGAS